MYQILLVPLKNPIPISAVSGTVNLKSICFMTKRLSVQVGILYFETMEFLLMLKMVNQFLLGMPWPCYYSPVVDWLSGDILSWVLTCHQNCLVNIKQAYSICAAETAPLPGLPRPYWGFEDILCKQQVENLPPHHDYFMTVSSIILLETMKPHGNVNLLARFETQLCLSASGKTLYKVSITYLPHPLGIASSF